MHWAKVLVDRLGSSQFGELPIYRAYMNAAKCGKSKLWLPFSDESALKLGDARIHRIPIAGVTAIPKRRFGSAISTLFWFPEHEMLLVRLTTYLLMSALCSWRGEKSLISPLATLGDRSNSACQCSRRKACTAQSFFAARAVVDC